MVGLRLCLPRPGGAGWNTRSFLYAFALGAAGGFAAALIGLPLPMLLGSVVTVGAAAMFGPLPGGLLPSIPGRLRTFFIPIIGVSIGSAFTAEILNDIGRWWPSLLALFFFVPLAHGIGFTMLRQGGIEPVTAYWGSVPGGLIESVMMGEEAGADVAMLTMLQFLRLILCIIVVPLGFTLVTGHAVGSSAGVEMGNGAALALLDWAVLALAGIIGYFVGQWLRFPAAFLTGPILISAIFHLVGLVEGAPPSWLIQIVQLVVGVSLGTRFAGSAPAAVLRAARLAGTNVALVLALAAVAALVLPRLTGEPWQAVVLAFAPGGVAEMSLVALSLDIAVLYVTAHHLLRIVLSIGIAKVFSARVLANEKGRPAGRP
ncbi:AbrB family transcriptional regulator [Roseitranquillus sediminis]|uniref:AbrB family transcriptional regulator n=1 Tax=Roseitranquillus sediminis TaxID=2809051 RepID=UPI001D0C75D8|nr:AbrB family transcriptional regulator [Roseitranquillus sediminis]MBM9595921.1 AbrB family transcriptional regulator [Roseitranquillus sediminis]